MVIKELPVLERPREKMSLYGCNSLSNTELLAVIIGNGTREKSAMTLAQEVLTMDQKGLSFLANCTIQELKRINGIGLASACRIIAATEIGKRIATTPKSEKTVIETYEDVAHIFMEKMRYYKEEHFQILLVNCHGGMISIEEVAVGDIMSMVVNPRQVFSIAVRKAAAGIVMAHNHPSGDCCPSDDDIQTTKRLISSGEIVGIPVLDHIVIGDGVFTSMKRNKLI